jgi:DNA end-binding protein Ku
MVGGEGPKRQEVARVPATIAKKLITFSLVSIPVTIQAATARHSIPLHLVHGGDCGARIRQPRVCEVHGEVPASDIARGYDLPTGETLVLTDKDLADLPTPDSREIRVLGFLPADRVDVRHYDKVYYLGVDERASRPYALLLKALEESGQVAIARTALRSRDSLVAIGGHAGVLTMTTLLWPDEVRAPEGIAPGLPTVRPEEVRMARELMDMVSSDFRLEEEQDEYTQALQHVVQARLAGLPAPHAPDARVLPPAQRETDLMAVLEAAVKKAQEEHQKANRARKSTTKKTTTPPAAAKKTATRKTAPARRGGQDDRHD